MGRELLGFEERPILTLLTSNSTAALQLGHTRSLGFPLRPKRSPGTIQRTEFDGAVRIMIAMGKRLAADEKMV